MSTFVYMTRCDGCGLCVDICPSDIMHIDETNRRAKNIEPNFSGTSAGGGKLSREPSASAKFF